MSIVEEFTSAEWAEMFAYLDGLRKSGMTNMLGAGPYLEGHFDMDVDIARQVLAVWMETFREKVPPLERANQ